MTAQAELAVGAAVKLHSLQAKPELNGRSGLIVTALDTETGRFGVRVDGIDKPLALKAANLTAAAIGDAASSQREAGELPAPKAADRHDHLRPTSELEIALARHIASRGTGTPV